MMKRLLLSIAFTWAAAESAFLGLLWVYSSA
jgi:hypothetical protein